MFLIWLNLYVYIKEQLINVNDEFFMLKDYKSCFLSISG